MHNSFKSKVPLFAVQWADTIKLLKNFFFSRKKLTGQHSFEEPFFIIGCGRSGNTLLRSMLVAGGQVAIPPESYVWPRVIRIFKTYNFLPWEKVCSLIIAEFEAYKEFYTWEVNLFEAHQKARQLEGKNRTLSNIINEVYKAYQIERSGNIKRWGDKTPINTLYIDKILKVYPKAKFVHIVRDPKDVVCSSVKAKIYKNYQEAANAWKNFETSVYKLKKKILTSQYHKVKYENLVNNTEEELKLLSKFLGVDYSESMLYFYKMKDELGDVKYQKHHENIGKPVSNESIGKWKKTLNNDEVSMINEILDK